MVVHIRVQLSGFTLFVLVLQDRRIILGYHKYDVMCDHV